MAARRLVTRLALGAALILGSALAVSDYAGRVEQQQVLKPENFLLQNPTGSTWLTWRHAGDLPAPDPAVTTACACSVKCLSDPGCFSYIHDNTTGCQLLPSRGRPKKSFVSGLSAGQLRYRDGMARLGDHCHRSNECSFVVENSKCVNQICACKGDLRAFEGECKTAAEIAAMTTDAPGTNTTAEPESGADSSPSSGGTDPTSTTGGLDPTPTTDGPEPTSSPGDAEESTTTDDPEESTTTDTTEEATTTDTTEEATTTDTTEEATTTAPEEPTTDDSEETTAAATTDEELSVVSLTGGGVKDTNNPWESVCPPGQVVVGTTMASTPSDEFDNPSEMICGYLRKRDGSPVPLDGDKEIIHLSSDGNTKSCGSTKVVTALYSSTTDTFRLEAMLCVDIGITLSSNCNEDEPKLGGQMPGPDNACTKPNAVVVGAKIKQNNAGWIEKFNCCELPTGYLAGIE